MNLRKALDIRHPDYLENAPFWQYYADHYAGGALYAMKPNPLPITASRSPGGSSDTRNYLWQYPLEMTDRYKHRVARAPYVNLVAPVVDFYCATVGKQDSVILDPGGGFEQFFDNADLQGQSLLQFMGAARVSATVRGHTFLLVDSTRPEGDVRTEADVIAQGVRPYVREVLPEDLLNWRLNGLGQPVEILYRAPAVLSGTVLDENSATLEWEYRFWSPKEWRIFRIEKDAAVEVASGPNPIGVVPLVPFYFKRVRPFFGESLLKDAAKIAQQVTNWVSALDEAFENQMFAVPTLKSRKAPAEVGVGISTVLHLDPGEDEEFTFTAPDTAPFEVSWQAVYRMIALANKHMGMAPVSVTDKVQEKSGVSKAWDFFEAEKIMSQMAVNEQESLKVVLDLAGKWMGREFSGSVQYASKYDMTSLADDIANLIALQSAGMPQAAREEMMRRTLAKALPSLDEAARLEIEKQIRAQATAPPAPVMPPAPVRPPAPVMSATLVMPGDGPVRE